MVQIAAGLDQLEREVSESLTRHGFNGFDRVVALIAVTWKEWQNSGAPLAQLRSAALAKFQEGGGVGGFLHDMFRDGNKPRPR